METQITRHKREDDSRISWCRSLLPVCLCLAGLLAWLLLLLLPLCPTNCLLLPCVQQREHALARNENRRRTHNCVNVLGTLLHFLLDVHKVAGYTHTTTTMIVGALGAVPDDDMLLLLALSFVFFAAAAATVALPQNEEFGGTCTIHQNERYFTRNFAI